jgi:hypothetical protein
LIWIVSLIFGFWWIFGLVSFLLLICFFIFYSSGFFKLLLSFLGFRLNIFKKFQKLFSVLFEHAFRTCETVFSHSCIFS